MPVLIDISTIQTFSNAPQNLYAPSWKFIPESPATYVHVVGSPSPDPLDVEIKIPNFHLLFPGFDSFKLELKPQFQHLQDLFMDLSGDFNWNTKTLVNFTSANLSIEFKNFENLMVPGLNLDFFGFKFLLYGTNNGVDVLLDFIRYYDINVIIPNGLNYAIFSPTELNFLHQKSQALPAGKTINVMASGDWELRHSSFLNIQGGSGSYTDPDGRNVITGNGNTTLTVALSFAFQNFEENLINLNLDLISVDDTTTISTAVVNVYILGTNHNALSDPASFHFFGLIGDDSPEKENLKILAPGTIDIDPHSFLDFSNISDSEILQTEVIPINQANLSVGIHEERIIVDTSSGRIRIPVTYEIVKLLSFDFAKNRKYFTKESKTLKVFSNDSGVSVAKVELIVTQGANTQTRNLEFPFFNKRGEFPLGLELHRMFEEVNYNFTPESSFIGQLNPSTNHEDRIMYPPSLDARVNVEVHVNDELFEKEIILVNFLKGYKPKPMYRSANSFAYATDHWGILSYTNAPMMVTPSGQGMLNFYWQKNKAGWIHLRINKNLTESISFTTNQTDVLGQKFSFKNYLPGDIIEIYPYQYQDIRIYTAAMPGRKFYVREETKYSYHLVWLNECNVLDMMQFTGNMKFSTDYEFQDVELTDEFVNRVERLGNDQSMKVICNTGFILEASLPYLKSIISAEKCWLQIDGRQPIKMIPTTTKITEFDQMNELYSYELQFKINPINNAEVYPS